MKAVFSAAQLAHAPTRFLSKGNIVAYPDTPERARALLEGARQAGASICASRRFDDTIYDGVHNLNYIEFLRNAFERWQEVDGAGPELLPSLRPVVPPEFRSNNIFAAAGRHLMDFSCAITAHTWKAAEASAMTAVTAADLVAKGDAVAYALCRPPGHHAYNNRAGGFCYLNNSALAAQRLLSANERVAILDIDVHHGNGTQSIFYRRADVLTVSIHADPRDYYPFYWGLEAEMGEAAGHGMNLNLPLPVGSGDETWLEALATALERIDDFDPGALVIALGLDAHEADPLQGGKVTQAGFARLAMEIAGLYIPTVIVQEGGYLTEHLADNLGMFLTAFEGAHEPPVSNDPEEAAKA
ncbi:MAG: histone deacetylase family protein [Rhizobiales bacterium]|nr:histone deacetylase family protein [Hyphomicrobiales bacterium]MBI3674481.1 histone deacetylase family protein [Hyphomicrobiales bacterium]